MEIFDAPLLEEAYETCFMECGLLEVHFPELVHAGESAFYCCDKLKKVTCEILEYISKDVFNGCRLDLLEMPELKTIGEGDTRMLDYSVEKFIAPKL